MCDRTPTPLPYESVVSVQNVLMAVGEADREFLVQSLGHLWRLEQDQVVEGTGSASEWVVSSKERRRISVDALEVMIVLEGEEEEDLRVAAEGSGDRTVHHEEGEEKS